MVIEGVAYQINWKKFKKGTSFLIPCLNCTTAIPEILKVMKRLKFQVITKCVIEDGIRGVRIWRM